MKNRRTLINTLSSLLLQIVTIVSGFIIPRLLLKSFGSEVNGLISSLNQFLNYITLVEGGLNAVILASLYKPLSQNDENKINSIISAADRFYKKISLIFIVYTVILGTVYPLLVKNSFGWSYIFSLTLILSINLFSQYCFSITWRTFLKADKKVYVVSIVQITCIIINTIGVAILINIYPNVHIVKLFSALIYLLQPLIFNLYVKKKYKINKKTEPDKQALAQRWDGLGINIAAFIHNNTDVVILTLLADLKSVSIYSVYYLVTTGLKNLITSISGGIVPTLGHAYAESNSEKLNKIFDRYELIIYIATFLLFVLGGILITPFVMIYTKGIYDAKGKNIVLSTILVIKFGIIGVAIATFIAMIYRTLAHMIYLQKNILYRDIKKTLKRLLVFIVSSGVIIILSKLLFSMEEVSILGWIIYAIKNTILALAAYGITILIFYRKQIELIINKRGKINETTK